MLASFLLYLCFVLDYLFLLSTSVFSVPSSLLYTCMPSVPILTSCLIYPHSGIASCVLVGLCLLPPFCRYCAAHDQGLPFLPPPHSSSAFLFLRFLFIFVDLRSLSLYIPCSVCTVCRCCSCECRVFSGSFRPATLFIH